MAERQWTREVYNKNWASGKEEITMFKAWNCKVLGELSKVVLPEFCSIVRKLAPKAILGGFS